VWVGSWTIEKESIQRGVLIITPLSERLCVFEHCSGSWPINKQCKHPNQPTKRKRAPEMTYDPGP
jgi:hypothetical protein